MIIQYTRKRYQHKFLSQNSNQQCSHYILVAGNPAQLIKEGTQTVEVVPVAFTQRLMLLPAHPAPVVHDVETPIVIPPATVQSISDWGRQVVPLTNLAHNPSEQAEPIESQVHVAVQKVNGNAAQFGKAATHQFYLITVPPAVVALRHIPAQVIPEAQAAQETVIVTFCENTIPISRKMQIMIFIDLSQQLYFLFQLIQFIVQRIDLILIIRSFGRKSYYYYNNEDKFVLQK